MKRNGLRNFRFLLLAAVAAIFPALALADQPLTVNTSPATIQIGSQFDGLRMEVSGTAPAGSEVVLRFTGAPSELHLREKGKVFGLLWMNVGKVTLKNVPKVCLVDCSSDFAKLGPAAEPFSLEGLTKRVEVEEGAEANTIAIDRELQLLKKNEGLYNEAEGGVVLGPDQNGTRTYSAVLPIPSALSPGNYLVEVIAVRDGQVIARASSGITAQMVGFPEWLSKLAFDRSLLYGVMATIIALVSGLAIGMVFQSKGAH